MPLEVVRNKGGHLLKYIERRAGWQSSIGRRRTGFQRVCDLQIAKPALMPFSVTLSLQRGRNHVLLNFCRPVWALYALVLRDHRRVPGHAPELTAEARPSQHWDGE